MGFNSTNLNFKDFSCLKINSNIILNSCYTGNDKDGNSIAEKLSKITDNRKIFAPITSATGFIFKNNQPYFIYPEETNNITAIYKNRKKNQ